LQKTNHKKGRSPRPTGRNAIEKSDFSKLLGGALTAGIKKKGGASGLVPFSKRSEKQRTTKGNSRMGDRNLKKNTSPWLPVASHKPRVRGGKRSSTIKRAQNLLKRKELRGKA